MRRRPSRYRRSSVYARRRRRNWAPFVVFVLVLSFFLWALFQFFSLLFANVRTEISSAQLEILQGRGEFRLSSENSSWTPAFSGQNFVEGDQPRSLINVTGTTFNVNVSPDADTLKLIKGGVQLDLLDTQKEIGIF